MKKFLLISAAAAVAIMSTISFVLAMGIAPKSFPDVPQDAWYANGVTTVSNEGWMNGYSNGMFGPSDAVTRAQLATILDRYNQKIAENTANLRSILCLNKDNASNNVKIQFSSAGDQQTYENSLKAFCAPQLLATDSGCERTYDPTTGTYTMGICK